jgi:hypothetical protein
MSFEMLGPTTVSLRRFTLRNFPEAEVHAMSAHVVRTVLADGAEMVEWAGERDGRLMILEDGPDSTGVVTCDIILRFNDPDDLLHWKLRFW